MLEVGVDVVGHPMARLQVGQLAPPSLEVGGPVPDGAPQVRRGHERRVEVRFLGEQAEGQTALPVHLAAIGLVEPGGDPEQRRLAGAVRPDEPDPVASAIAASIGSRITNVPISRRTPVEPQDRHQAASAGRDGVAGPVGARAAARRVAAARSVRSVRLRAVGRGPPRRRQPDAPLAADLGPAPPRRRVGPPRHLARIARRPFDRPPTAAGTTSRSASPAPPITIRRIGRPQRGHGWPARW